MQHKTFSSLARYGKITSIISNVNLQLVFLPVNKSGYISYLPKNLHSKTENYKI